MATFNLGSKVRFTAAVLARTQHAGSQAVGVVVGYAGVSAVRVDFLGTWEAHEDGSTVRAVPRKNLEVVPRWAEGGKPGGPTPYERRAESSYLEHMGVDF